MSNSANLPAPYLGVEQNLPLAVIRSPYCENLFNFNVTQGGLSLRNGDSEYLNIPSLSAGEIPIGFVQYGNTAMFLATKNTAGDLNIYNMAGSVVYTDSAVGVTHIGTFNFRDSVYVFDRSSIANSVVYNGTTWTNPCGYTGTSLNPAGGAVYKNRAYLIQFETASYWYSEIDATSGAMTQIDLTGVLLERATLSAIHPITIAENVNSVTLLAFVFSNGEVLFYSGTYPNSSTWQLEGMAKIGSPLNYNCIMAYQGDGLVPCDSGLVSLRDLFLTGSGKAASLTVSDRVQTAWVDLVQAIRTLLAVPVGPLDPTTAPKIKGVWDQKTNRIIVSFGYYINSSGALSTGSFYFVFNTKLQSWFFQRSFGDPLDSSMRDIARFQNKVLIVAGDQTEIMIWEKEGATGFTDRNLRDSAERTYDYEMLSAPIPFPKTAVYEATQIEPILESDLYAQTNWNFVVDFGRQTSGNQKTDAATTNVAKPAVNVGMQNITYVQVKMSGTTAESKTVGLDLYSYNVWYSAGEVGSR